MASYKQLIYELICREEGLYLAEIARKLGCSYLTVWINIKLLEAEGLIEIRNVGGMKFVYPKKVKYNDKNK